MIEVHWFLIFALIIFSIAILIFALSVNAKLKKKDSFDGVLIINKSEAEIQGQGVYVNFTKDPRSFKDRETVIFQVWDVQE